VNLSDFLSKADYSGPYVDGGAGVHIEDVHPFGIGEHNTCSNGPDDGTLNKDAARFWNCRRHASTAEAVTNLLLPPAGGNFNIIGHGNTGLFETGMGQTGPFNANELIVLWTQYVWGPQLQRLVPANFALLSLWSCHTGEGADGADLLFAMAQVVGRAVRASNGFLYVNDQNIWFENGSVWVVATPNSRPTPVPAPSPHNLEGIRMTDKIFLRLHAGDGEVSNECVIEGEIVKNTIGRPTQPQKIPKAEAQRLAVMMLASRPFTPPGTPMALITATISLTFDIDNKEQKRKFVVYNDRLVFDSTSGAYYHCPTALRGAIASL